MTAKTTPRDKENMRELHISEEMSEMLLKSFCSGTIQETLTVKRFPGDKDNIQKLNRNMGLSLPSKEWMRFKSEYNINNVEPRESDGICQFDYNDLYNTGLNLLPYYSYGVLNGGSASSYCDSLKNSQYSSDLYRFYQNTFNSVSEEMKGKPKGITPGYFPSTNTGGPSFLELKLRALILLYRKSRDITGKTTSKIPFFQMTSDITDQAIREHLAQIESGGDTQALLHSLGWSTKEIESAVQPLCAALKETREEQSSGYFRNAEGSLLAIPGGHGQNYRVLKPVYERLYKEGIRYISLGNIDNLGYTAHPVLLAVCMMKNTDAAFEFSYKTPLDKKGGVLVVDKKNRINCADIGAGILQEDIEKAEADGNSILFNCASGIFKLSFLLDNFDYIQKNLPVRFNYQKKEIGNYVQGEQNTWEIIPLIENKIIFGVEKSERFLASKMLLETFITSGLDQNSPDFPEDADLAGIKLGQMARYLNKGLKQMLSEIYELS